MRKRAGFRSVGLRAGYVAVLALTTAVGVRGSEGDDRGLSPAGNQKPSLKSIRGAVVRALPLLVKASAVEYPKHRDCFSCHNQAVPAVALGLAAARF